jgi:hypothetical protein
MHPGELMREKITVSGVDLLLEAAGPLPLSTKIKAVVVEVPVLQLTLKKWQKSMWGFLWQGINLLS